MFDLVKYGLFKKIIAISLSFEICFSFILVNTVKSSADTPLPTNISIYGGSYNSIRAQTYDHQKFEVHHLISRSALNSFAKYVFSVYGKSIQSEFLENSNQAWAPSILLTKEDHLKTLSRSKTGYDFSLLYISEQAFQMIQYGAFLELLLNELSYIQKYINTDGKYDKGMQQAYSYINSMDIKPYKNKLSFYPFGNKKDCPRFNYIIPKQSIFSLNMSPSLPAIDPCSPKDATVQVDNSDSSGKSVDKSVQTEPAAAETSDNRILNERLE